MRDTPRSPTHSRFRSFRDVGPEGSGIITEYRSTVCNTLTDQSGVAFWYFPRLMQFGFLNETVQTLVHE